MKVQIRYLKFIEEDMKKIMDMDIPIKLSYKFLKIYNEIAKELEVEENLRVSLIKKYGVPNEDNPQTVSVPPEKMEEFMADYNPLLDQEVDLDVDDKKINMSDLLDSNINIPPKTILNLSVFFDQE